MKFTRRLTGVGSHPSNRRVAKVTVKYEFPGRLYKRQPLSLNHVNVSDAFLTFINPSGKRHRVMKTIYNYHSLLLLAVKFVKARESNLKTEVY